MRKWFWPLVTWTAAVTSLALWFGAGFVTSDISSRAETALQPFPWASFDVDGRDIVLTGIAPDPESQAKARMAIEQLSGVRDVIDSTALLPIASPYEFTLSRRGDVLTLSGSIPDNQFRERIMQEAEQVPGLAVSDEMALARGASDGFRDMALQTLQWIAKLKDGDIEISDKSVSIIGTAATEEAYSELGRTLTPPLLSGFTLSKSDVKRPY